MLSTLPLFYIAQSVNSDDRRTRIQGLRVIRPDSQTSEVVRIPFGNRTDRERPRTSENQARESDAIIN